MATVMCQGLQSCLHESQQLVEPRTLRLMLSSPKPHFTQPPELAFKSCFFFDSNPKETDQEKCHYEEISRNSNCLQDKHIFSSPSSNPDLGHYSFLQALCPVSETPKLVMETTKAYVHPMAIKRTLSEKSLELCTENLGSETGTDHMIEQSIFSLSSPESSPKSERSSTRQHQQPEQQQRPRQSWGANKKVSSANFPPPLTTISGSESIRFRSHREDGRLTVEAVKAPSSHIIFNAERSHGRLRLCLFKDSNFDSNEVTTEEENEANKELGFEEEDTYEEEDDSCFSEENDDGNCLDVGGENGIDQNFHPRFSRCKEVGERENKHNLLHWGLAIS